MHCAWIEFLYYDLYVIFWYAAISVMYNVSLINTFVISLHYFVHIPVDLMYLHISLVCRSLVCMYWALLLCVLFFFSYIFCWVLRVLLSIVKLMQCFKYRVVRIYVCIVHV
jgi:hypothetical protein